jgi:hypothetical protein
MAKNENQTRPTKVSVSAYITSLPEARRADVKTLVKMMQNATDKKAVMWGPSIIGFDEYHYVYASGREGDAPIIAFSPRAQSLALYINSDSFKNKTLMKKFGKYRMSGSCLHIKKLSDVDLDALETLIEDGVKDGRKRHHAK